MIEVVATVLITVGSILLFAYWFRYTCLLILSAKTIRDYAASVAKTNDLVFLEVQTQLQQGNLANLDHLHSSLDRDYRVIMSLIKYAANANTDSSSALETRMLAIDYKLMGAWYSITRRFSNRIARQALEEMLMVVTHFANTIGERAACAGAA